MKLISARYASSWERKHAFSSEEAATQVQQRLGAGQSIDGLDQLGRFLMLDVVRETLQQVESAEWLLIKPEAYYFDWGQFEPSVREQRAMAMLHSPPPQPKEAIQVLRVVDSETADRLDNRRCVTTVEGARANRRTDGLGVTHLPEPGKGAKIELQVFAN